METCVIAAWVVLSIGLTLIGQHIFCTRSVACGVYTCVSVCVCVCPTVCVFECVGVEGGGNLSGERE